MEIFVKAKAGSKENKIIPPKATLWAMEDKGDEFYIVSVKEKPVQGRANTAICKVLAEHFKVSPSQVTLVSGASSKRKVFEIVK